MGQHRREQQLQGGVRLGVDLVTSVAAVQSAERGRRGPPWTGRGLRTEGTHPHRQQ